MTFTAYRWMISTVLSRERGLKRRPLPLHPIPGSSKKGEHYQQKTIVFASPNFRLIPRWNQIPISGSFLDWKMLGVRTAMR